MQHSLAAIEAGDTSCGYSIIGCGLGHAVIVDVDGIHWPALAFGDIDIGIEGHVFLVGLVDFGHIKALQVQAAIVVPLVGRESHIGGERRHEAGHVVAVDVVALELDVLELGVGSQFNKCEGVVVAVHLVDFRIARQVECALQLVVAAYERRHGRVAIQSKSREVVAPAAEVLQAGQLREVDTRELVAATVQASESRQVAQLERVELVVVAIEFDECRLLRDIKQGELIGRAVEPGDLALDLNILGSHLEVARRVILGPCHFHILASSLHAQAYVLAYGMACSHEHAIHGLGRSIFLVDRKERVAPARSVFIF